MPRPTDLIARAVRPDVINGTPDFFSMWDFVQDSEVGAFTITASGTGASAPTSVDASSQNGTVALNTGTADNSYVSFQSKAGICLVPGRTAVVGGRCRFNEATQNDVFLGLAVTDTDLVTSVASGGGIWLLKDDDAATWEANKQVVASLTVVKDAIATLSADTWFNWGIVVDVLAEGYADISWFIGGNLVAFAKETTVPASSVVLRASMCHQAGNATQRTGLVDFLFLGGRREA